MNNEAKKQPIDLDNPQLQNALQIVNYTQQSLFITGKAGTGKSTLLRHIAATTKKKHVILAPTGIAAINAGGATLHSFFKLPFHPLLPDDNRYSIRHIREALKYSGEKCKLLREVELIIIDEISMVRADIIDFIDKVLRVYCRNMREPFAGKQLLFVGDVYQLEPVVKEDERRMLAAYYPSPYFFDARVFRTMPLVSIELTKVYRQSDQLFISILDHIRTNTIGEADLRLLNQRCASSRPSGTKPEHHAVYPTRHRRPYQLARAAKAAGRACMLQRHNHRGVPRKQYAHATGAASEAGRTYHFREKRHEAPLGERHPGHH